MITGSYQVDNNPVEYLTQNKYNELSQLESKKVGGIAAGSLLQQIDYRYNIRGWMTRINDPANLNGKLFGYEIKYQNPSYSNVSIGKYNGNIAEVDWSTADNGQFRRYNYQYNLPHWCERLACTHNKQRALIKSKGLLNFKI